MIDGRDQGAPVYIARPRAVRGGTDIETSARAIVDDVRLRGDDALVEHTAHFDRADVRDGLRVPPEVIEHARDLVRPELIDALEVMAERLRSTCERRSPKSWIERSSDQSIGELVRPLRRVGIYVPGGRAAYPSTVMMAAVPARVAGVGEVAVCTPPRASGDVPEVVLAACAVVGIEEVYRVGGAQAIAALAYGTQSVRPVDKIVGPGNAYVAFAKRAVQGDVGVDTEAGPTEIAIVAGDDADARSVAADLVAQAEHGPHGTHALITWSKELLERVVAELDTLVAMHERPDDVENALIEGGRGVLVRDLEHALRTVNLFAPEHLELCFEGAFDRLDDVRNAGAVFVGPFTPVSVGDYVAGTNHVLPSGGTARWASGLGVEDFTKRIYVASLEAGALRRLAPHIDALAEAEGLGAHARAVAVRLDGG